MIARDRIVAHDMLLTPGTRLGPYTIETPIGSGGIGEVYQAHDERLNRRVAIKRMIAEDVSRFQSETRAIAAINHPHICQIIRGGHNLDPGIVEDVLSRHPAVQGRRLSASPARSKAPVTPLETRITIDTLTE